MEGGSLGGGGWAPRRSEKKKKKKTRDCNVDLSEARMDDLLGGKDSDDSGDAADGGRPGNPKGGWRCGAGGGRGGGAVERDPLTEDVVVDGGGGGGCCAGGGGRPRDMSGLWRLPRPLEDTAAVVLGGATKGDEVANGLAVDGEGEEAEDGRGRLALS